MCGASAQQNELASEEATAYQQATQMTAEQYGKQSAIYAQMSPMFESIFSKGPNQEGFSGSEVQDLNAEAIQGTAQNYNQAAEAVGEQTAAEGGGTNPMPTGAQLQLKQEVANSAAATESGEESQIKQADYSQGYNEWENAAAGLSGIATGENPLGFENAETSSAGAANSEANAVEDANNSWINAAIGAVGQIGGSFASGGLSSLTSKGCWIAAELWGGWGDPRVISVREWLHNVYSQRWTGRLVLVAYLRYGERTAQAIRRWPILRLVFEPIFNSALRRARRKA